ncbi:unnamed protein product [Cyclocybe aegerita]|uniref:Thioester reductase (TE) domain-containing protein n=1 Tax=Cyclocybe aegerita TaxID=1973307 RepID=A0A8S0X4U1_CYCAE|nr:unnamed protein product [Cyclocybe aegerita]
MASKLNIFFTGATGYVGGSILSRLLNHKDAASFQITALVRSTDKAEKLRTLGVDTLIGSYTDENLSFLTEAASKADVYVQADADKLPPAQAILDGLKPKYEASSTPPILIHTSGTGILLDDARGLHSGHIRYSDLETDKLDALPVTVWHRNVDVPILEADKAGYVKAYIIAPSLVFGEPKGPLIDLGIQNGHTMLIEWLAKASITRKQGGYIGKGVNKWGRGGCSHARTTTISDSEAAQYRQRSPDETPSESSDDARVAPLTKSPHTRRVVKRGRINGPATPPSPSPATNLPQQESLTGLHRPTKTNKSQAPWDDMKHLEQMLDSVLASAVIIQAASTIPVELTPHSRSALAAIINILQPHTTMPTAPMSTTALHTATKPYPPPATEQPARRAENKSYAHAASHKTGQSVNRKEVSLAGQMPHPLRRAKAPATPRHSPFRLTLRWPNQPPSLPPGFLMLLLDQLNYNFQEVGEPPPIMALNRTKAGNIIILTRAPVLASALLARQDNVLRSFDKLSNDFKQSEDPILELDVPWHGFVIHNVPALGLAEVMDSPVGHGHDLLVRIKVDIGIPGAHIRDYRVLQRDNSWKEDVTGMSTVSFLIMLDDEGLADRLLSFKGNIHWCTLSGDPLPTPETTWRRKMIRPT